MNPVSGGNDGNSKYENNPAYDPNNTEGKRFTQVGTQQPFVMGATGSGMLVPVPIDTNPRSLTQRLVAGVDWPILAATALACFVAFFVGEHLLDEGMLGDVEPLARVLLIAAVLLGGAFCYQNNRRN